MNLCSAIAQNIKPSATKQPLNKCIKGEELKEQVLTAFIMLWLWEHLWFENVHVHLLPSRHDSPSPSRRSNPAQLDWNSRRNPRSCRVCASPRCAARGSSTAGHSWAHHRAQHCIAQLAQHRTAGSGTVGFPEHPPRLQNAAVHLVN